jgi:hypothetical protein
MHHLLQGEWCPVFTRGPYFDQAAGQVFQRQELVFMHYLLQGEWYPVFTWRPYFDQAGIGLQVKYSSNMTWQSCATFCKVSGALFSPGALFWPGWLWGLGHVLQRQELAIMCHILHGEWCPVFIGRPYIYWQGTRGSKGQVFKRQDLTVKRHLLQDEWFPVFTRGPYFDKADVWLQIRYSSDRTWQSCAIFGKMNIALFHTKTLCWHGTGGGSAFSSVYIQTLSVRRKLSHFQWPSPKIHIMKTENSTYSKFF